MPFLSPAVLEPFSFDFVQRALVGGGLVAVLCGVVGTWVVVRGMAFLGEALAHGLLPGVAIATVLGAPVLVGGAVSAVVMSLGVAALQRRGRLSYDTSIGLLFVAMLALGVVVVSHSGSFATDATSILFGDVLAITSMDLGLLAGATIVTLVTFVTLFTTVVLCTLTFCWMRMPTFTTGGAPVTTAGDVPSGAGTTMPAREPGGGGTNTPSGPIGGGPGRTPAPTTASVMRSDGGGGTNTTSGADQ